MKKLIIVAFILINIGVNAQFQIGISNKSITAQYVIDNSTVIHPKIGLYSEINNGGLLLTLDSYLVQDRYYSYKNGVLIGISGCIGKNYKDYPGFVIGADIHIEYLMIFKKDIIGFQLGYKKSGYMKKDELIENNYPFIGINWEF